MVDVAFWPNTTDLKVASFRIRTMRVINELKRVGVDAREFHEGMNPKAIVVSKRYDERTFECCKRLVAQGTRLIIDLCDNHFFCESDSELLIKRAGALKRLCAICDTVVVTSSYMKEVVLSEVGACIVYVVDDFVNIDGSSIKEGLLNKLKIFLYRRKLRSYDKASLKLVWYGNHGSPGVAGGMEDLLLIGEGLRKLIKDRGFVLTVVSNNEKKYREIARKLKVCSIYVEWDPVTIKTILMMQDVCLVPATLNPFTKAKSTNRATYSLALGIPVVSDNIPSYVESSESGIYTGNLENDVPTLVLESVSHTVKFDIEKFNEKVLSHWLKVLA